MTTCKWGFPYCPLTSKQAGPTRSECIYHTWDTLFSVPVSWAAPVLAPVIVSLVLIGFGIIVLYLSHRKYEVKIPLPGKVAASAGLLLVLFSMTIDAFFQPRIYLYHAPVSFRWGSFGVGIFLVLIVMGGLLVQSLRASDKSRL